MSLRPLNPPKIALDDLQPGDILLSAGSNPLDQLIMMIDQGDYSHTTQYIGKIDGVHKVVEATQEGIKFHSTKDDMDIQDLVDAYRYVSPDGHHFGEPGWDVQPVLDKAMSFVGADYAYSDLFLCAVVILASEIPKQDILREIIILLGNDLVDKIIGWLNNNSKQVPMTCVQVATSAFWQAASTPPNKYGLQVVINNGRKPLEPSNELTHYKNIRKRLSSNLNSSFPNLVGNLNQPKERLTVFAGSDLLPLGTCTPRDLQTSPTLKFVGCLKDTRK